MNHVEAQVRDVPRDWSSAVRPAVGDQVVFATKQPRLLLVESGGQLARHAPNRQQKGWVSSQDVTLTGKEPVKWQTPLKAGPSLRRAIGTRRDARRR